MFGAQTRILPGSFQPNWLNITCWLDPTFGIVASGSNITTWTDRVQGVVCTTAGGTPTIGNNLNGRASVNFDGASYFSCPQALSNFISAAAYTTFRIHNYTGAIASQPSAPYLEGDIFGDTNAYFGFSCSATTSAQWHNDTATWKYDALATTPSTNYYYYAAYYDGSKIHSSVNGGAFDAGTSAGNVGSMVGAVHLGSGYTQLSYFQGYVGDIIMSNVVLTTNQINQLNAWAHMRYGI